MIVVNSNLRDLYKDLEFCVSQEEDVFAYLMCDRVAIWDCVFRVKELEDNRFNMKYIEDNDILVMPMPVKGGTIVNNIGDLGFLVVSNDMYSKWETAVMKDLSLYLKLKYNISTEIKNNDMLIDGHKFIGTANGFLNDNRRLSAMFISINPWTEKLIKEICVKENLHEGFTGLAKYNVEPGDLLNRLMAFTMMWEGKQL